MQQFLKDGLHPGRPVIIELFGRVCQNSPKDGSHLFSQTNSKHHGQTFRHLTKGRQRFFGICPCCINPAGLVHWAPVILRQLQDTEDAYRAAHPSWMDLEVAPDDIKTQWQEANANRRMQFKVGV